MERYVAILEVMWGSVYMEEGYRFFRINRDNYTGKRLYRIMGDRNFLVTNACPQMVTSPKHRGTPNAEWLRGNLKTLSPVGVLVCGGVARRTFAEDMVSPDCRVVHLPHPAARWSSFTIQEAEFVIDECFSGRGDRVQEVTL